MSSLDAILKRLTNGEITHAEAELIIRRELKIDEYARVAEIAKLDTARMHRVGIPEVVLAEGKNTEDLLAIVEAQLKAEGRAVLTRVSEQQLQALQRFDIEWHDRARIAVVGKKPHRQRRGLVGIVCAGTADISVAEEARVVAEEFGCKTIKSYDVGVAGIHRLYPELQKLLDADVLIVLAGREGALPTLSLIHISEPTRRTPISYAVFCLKKKKNPNNLFK